MNNYMKVWVILVIIGIYDKLSCICVILREILNV